MSGRVTRSGRGVADAGVSTPTNGQRMQVSAPGAGEDGQGARSSVGFEGGGLSLRAKLNRLKKKDLLDIMMQLMSKGDGDEDEEEPEDDEDVEKEEDAMEKLPGEGVEVSRGATSNGVGVEVHASPSEATAAYAANDEGSYVPSEGELPKVTFNPEKVLCEVFHGKHFPAWSFQFMLQMEAVGMWDIFTGKWVPPPQDDVAHFNKYKKCDILAFSTLCRHVAPAIVQRLKPFASGVRRAPRAWAYLADTYHPKDDSTRGELMEKLTTIRMSKGEKVEDYCNRAAALRDELLLIGATVAEEEYIVYLKKGLPKEWDNIKRSLNTSGAKQSETWVVQQLIKEERMMAASWSHGDEDEEARAFMLQGRERGGGGGKQGGSQGGGYNRMKGNPKKGGWKKPLKCFYCSEVGHPWFKCGKAPEGWVPAGWSSHNGATSTPRPQANATASVMVGDASKDGGREARPEMKAAFACQSVLLSNEEGHDDLKEESWYLDSACTQHMTPRADWVRDLQPSKVSHVRMGDLRLLPVQGEGFVMMEGMDGFEVTFHHVLLVEGLCGNLLSLGQVMEKGVRGHFRDMKMYFQTPGGTTFTEGVVRGRMVELSLKTHPLQGVQANVARGTKGGLQLWHNRLVHASHGTIKGMARKDVVKGLLLEDEREEECPACVEGKMAREKFPTHEDVGEKPLQVVHADLCGPFRTPTRGGAIYFLLLIDQATRYTWGTLLQRKSEVVEKLKVWLPMAERQCDARVKFLRTDNGLEFVNHEVKAFLQAHGIERQRSCPRTQQQNGVVERANRTMVEKVRCMLSAMELPPKWWGEAFEHALWVKNRLTTKPLGGEKTPFEALFGVKPNLEMVRVFGCMVQYYVHDELRGKLDMKARWGMHIGMSHESKGWKVIDVENGKTTVTRDAVFYEGMSWKKWKHGEEKGCGDFLSLLIGTEENGGEEEEEKEEVKGVVTRSKARRSLALLTHSTCDDDPHGVEAESDEVVAVIGGEETEEEDEEAPRSLKEAMTMKEASKWKEAADEEMRSLEEQGTWELVDLPPGRKVVGVKWVFTKKRDEHGNVVKFKGRLVAKGYSQIAGLDYGETYAPVGSFTTARVLLAVAAARDLELWQMDVKNAFLHGKIDREIYMRQPEGYEDGSNRVCKLVKSLYGLKQSPRVWYEALDGVLLKHGFVKSIADVALYYKDGVKGERMWLLVYVDDLLMASKSEEVLQETHDILASAFNLKRIEPVVMYLGMQIKRDRARRRLELHQTRYVEKVKERYGGQFVTKGVKGVPRTPLRCMKWGEELHDLYSGRPMHEYQQMMGSLMHSVVCTRPDMAYACSKLASCTHVRADHHWEELERCMKYLMATGGARLVYEGGEEALRVLAYSDADDASDPRDWKSRSGVLIMFGGAAVLWKSKKQGSVTLSSTESEYVAATLTAQEVIWMRILVKEFQVEVEGSVPLMVDNKSAITLSKEPSLHGRTRHMGRRLSWLRQQVMRGMVKLHYVPTKQQVADFLTKNLPGPDFRWCREACGLHVVE